MELVSRGAKAFCAAQRVRSRLLLEHDLFRKPVSTFRDHALGQRLRYTQAVRTKRSRGAAIALARLQQHEPSVLRNVRRAPWGALAWRRRRCGELAALPLDAPLPPTSTIP